MTVKTAGEASEASNGVEVTVPEAQLRSTLTTAALSGMKSLLTVNWAVLVLVKVQVTVSPSSTSMVAVPVPVLPELLLVGSTQVMSVRSQPEGTVSVTE